MLLFGAVSGQSRVPLEVCDYSVWEGGALAILELLNETLSVWIVGDYRADDYKFKWKWSLNTMTGWITMRDEPADWG